MAVDTQETHVHGEFESNDVPVDKKTSFNGRLNQYFHASKNVAVAQSSSKMVVATSGGLKRDSSSQGLESGSPVGSHNSENDNGSEALRSKRRKGDAAATISRTNTNTTNTSAAMLPARMTRSRSASLLQSQSQSPALPSPTDPILTRTRSPATTTPTPAPTRRTLGRGSRKPNPQTTTTKSLLRDTIPPNLTLLLVGVNPGLQTGITGHAYAHPSNLFWKLLHWSGITPIRHPPSDTYALPGLYNIGNTNIVERPTRDASMLSRAEMDAGVPVLEGKVREKRPEVVCLVGKSIWEAVFRVRHGRGIRREEFGYGWQDTSENMGRVDGERDWEGARVFVATTTSGLAAGMSMGEKLAVWKELGEFVVRRRGEQQAIEHPKDASMERTASLHLGS